MDVISYSKAVKAKKKSEKIKKRLGLEEYRNGELDVVGEFENVKQRLEKLEEACEGKNQDKSIILKTNNDFKKGVRVGLEVSENRLKGEGNWEIEIDLGEDAIQLGKIEWRTAVEVNEDSVELEDDLNKSYSFYENNFSGIIIATDTGNGYRVLGESQIPSSPFRQSLKIRITLDGTCELDQLIISYNVSPIWDRISDVEKNISINLNKHNLRVNSILNQSAYKFTDMIFDDFHNEDGIDVEKSKGYIFDSSRKIIKIDPSKEKAEIVLKSEEVNNPTKLFISIAINEQTEKEIKISFEKGNHEGVIFEGGVMKLNKRNEEEYNISGYFESSIIDLGTNIKRIKSILSEYDAPSNSIISVLFKTSKDSMDFTEYKSTNDIENMNIDDRFVKVKLELRAAVTLQPKSLLNLFEIDEGVMKDGETISIQSLDKILKRINDISNDSKNLLIPFFYDILKRKNNIATYDFEFNEVVKELGYLSIKGYYS
ncbi:hypothetical protein [Bacillus atrophaeus]|uniref:hypothetical protein n=1 Tax=Bacillus atrophaeus TaxID=1452 RepID=UPI00228125EA|nr:hypothetical protein [Bacillus atrophaeus]MCY8466569.1 hypothetical protein [Bacillus atrophaeus]MCY8479029.1 hypothetical protein [Bacillus atrophaeus]